MKFCLENIASIAIQIKTGKTPPTKVLEYFNGNINWYTPTDLSKEPYLSKSSRTITDKAILENRAVVFDKDTVLISCIGDIGKLGIVATISSSNQQITGIKLTNKVSPLFFYYWCKRNKKLLENNSRRAIVPILNNEALARIKISYPESYDDQIRITTILTRAEKLITKRKESIKMLAELLKSTFLEMFGDPVRNEKGWERVKIRNLIIEAKYGTSKSAKGGRYKYLRMNNITNEGYWDFSSLKYIDVSESEKEKYSLKINDLVFNRTNSKELVGKTAVYNSDEEVIIAGYLIRVRTKPNVNPWYIWGYLNSKAGKLRLFNLCRNIVGMANINAQELQDIPILRPPFELQNQFAAIVEKAESLKAKYTQSLNELENLYGSLSQRAFKGELDLSRVPVEKEKQIVDLQGEVKEASSASKKYSEEELIKIIQSLAGKNFSFDFLVTELEKASFEELPKYEQLKNQIYEMLEGPNPLLSQTLVDIKKESGAVKKKIMLSVNK